MVTNNHFDEAMRLLAKAATKTTDRKLISRAVRHLIRFLAGKKLVSGIVEVSGENLCSKCQTRRKTKQRDFCYKCYNDETDRRRMNSRDKEELPIVSRAEMLFCPEREDRIVTHQNRIMADLERIETQRSQFAQKKREK